LITENVFLTSKMAFLLVTITFMRSEIKIVTSKNLIIDIENEHGY